MAEAKPDAEHAKNDSDKKLIEALQVENKRLLEEENLRLKEENQRLQDENKRLQDVIEQLRTIERSIDEERKIHRDIDQENVHESTFRSSDDQTTTDRTPSHIILSQMVHNLRNQPGLTAPQQAMADLLLAGDVASQRQIDLPHPQPELEA